MKFSTFLLCLSLMAEAFSLVSSKDLPESLKWLEGAMNPDGSLRFLKGNYRLGLNETSPVDQDCTDANGNEGNCVLLLDCTEIHPIIKDENTFKEYFCAIETKYAGVCCPRKN